MYNWNSVYLRYCDGGSFSGDNRTQTLYEGVELFFRGKLNREAAFSFLAANASLATMTDVLITGCSAGGLATYLHVDQWCDSIKNLKAEKIVHTAERNTTRRYLPFQRVSKEQYMKCVGMPDSGFFLDYEAPGVDFNPYDPAEQPADTVPGNYRVGLKWNYFQQNSSASVNQDCLASHASEGDEFDCIFAEHAAAYVHTPLFALQSRYDSWQTGSQCQPLLPLDVHPI